MSSMLPLPPVPPPVPPPPPPSSLRVGGKRLWSALVAEYVPDPHELVQLHRCCVTLDEIERMERELRRADLVVPGHSGQPRANPLISQVRLHRDLLDRQLARLVPSPSDARRRKVGMGDAGVEEVVKHRRRGQRLGIAR